jgi:hypothetical protein
LQKSGDLPIVWVSFDLFGTDFEPSELTELLGVDPTSNHRSGDEIGAGPGARHRDRWRITIGPTRTLEIGGMLSDLIERLSPAADLLKTAYSRFHVEGMITCGVERQSAEMPYLLFPGDILRWAADHDVAIAVDVMLWERR